VDDAASDQQLLERIAFGDTTAFWELWLRHEIYIRQICRRMGGNEDDVHDVMLKLMVKLPFHAAKISNLRAWMGKLAQNFCIDKYRAARNRMDFVSLDDVDLADPRSLAHDPALSSPPLDKMIDNMSAPLREAMALRFLQNLSYKQIALQLNVPETRIRKRVERGRRLLRRELENVSAPIRCPAGKSEDEASPGEIKYTCSFLRLVPVVFRRGIEVDVPLAIEEKAGRSNLTIAALRRYMHRHPYNMKKHLRLAQLLYDTGRWCEGVDEHLRILCKQPDIVSILLQLGEMYHAMGNAQEAFAIYSRALEAARMPSTRHYIQGLIALSNREYNIGFRQFDEAVSLDPEQPAFRWAMLGIHGMNGNLDETVRIALEILGANPLDANAHIACCYSLSGLGRIEEARYHALECLKNDPENMLALKFVVNLRCAHLLMVRGDEGRTTLRMIKTMLTLSPRAAEAHEALARFYISRGQYERGLSILHKFVSDYPNKPFGWFYYSLWLFQSGNDKAAGQAMARAHSLYPEGRITWEKGYGVFSALSGAGASGFASEEVFRHFPVEWNPWFAASPFFCAVNLGFIQ